jgi:hypothetical protein
MDDCDLLLADHVRHLPECETQLRWRGGSMV